MQHSHNLVCYCMFISHCSCASHLKVLLWGSAKKPLTQDKDCSFGALYHSKAERFICLRITSSKIQTKSCYRQKNKATVGQSHGGSWVWEGEHLQRSDHNTYRSLQLELRSYYPKCMRSIMYCLSANLTRFVFVFFGLGLNAFELECKSKSSAAIAPSRSSRDPRNLLHAERKQELFARPVTQIPSCIPSPPLNIKPLDTTETINPSDRHRRVPEVKRYNTGLRKSKKIASNDKRPKCDSIPSPLPTVVVGTPPITKVKESKNDLLAPPSNGSDNSIGQDANADTIEGVESSDSSSEEAKGTVLESGKIGMTFLYEADGDILPKSFVIDMNGVTIVYDNQESNIELFEIDGKRKEGGIIKAKAHLANERPNGAFAKGISFLLAALIGYVTMFFVVLEIIGILLE